MTTDSERRRGTCDKELRVAVVSLWNRLMPVYQSDRIRQSTMLPASRIIGQINHKNNGALRTMRLDDTEPLQKNK